MPVPTAVVYWAGFIFATTLFLAVVARYVGRTVDAA